MNGFEIAALAFVAICIVVYFVARLTQAERVHELRRHELDRIWERLDAVESALREIKNARGPDITCTQRRLSKMELKLRQLDGQLEVELKKRAST